MFFTQFQGEKIWRHILGHLCFRLLCWKHFCQPPIICEVKVCDKEITLQNYLEHKPSPKDFPKSTDFNHSLCVVWGWSLWVSSAKSQRGFVLRSFIYTPRFSDMCFPPQRKTMVSSGGVYCELGEGIKDFTSIPLISYKAPLYPMIFPYDWWYAFLITWSACWYQRDGINQVPDLHDPVEAERGL
jgi:hypothetical protein